MPPSVDLSVIIPVHNAADTIEQIVQDFVSIDAVRTEVILVDDSSTDGSARVIKSLAAENPRVTAKSHRVNRGAGVARNTGFAAAAGRYTIFFDADDIVHAHAIESVIPLMDESAADTAVLPYRYRRGKSVAHEAMNHFDVEIWDSYVGDTEGSYRVGTLDEFPRLLGFSNYPWNKVIRTERFREVGLRYGATPVHNDILGHWYSLLFARTLLLLDDEVCTHIVEAGGSNLSNQHTSVRISLFDALDETYDLLEEHPSLRNRYSHHYWASVIRTADWAQTRIAPEFLDEFKLRFQRHLLRANLSDYSRIRMKRNRSLADAMIQRSLT